MLQILFSLPILPTIIFKDNVYRSTVLLPLDIRDEANDWLFDMKKVRSPVFHHRDDY